MFKNLRTSTKLLILCSMFIMAIGVTTYSLIAEKRIAIDFARKELVGTRYLAVVRETYAAIVTDPEQVNALAGALILALAEAQAAATPVLNTAELEQDLAATLGQLRLTQGRSGRKGELTADALAKARSLAARIGDDSNLTLDPDLDTYYLQDIVVGKLPTLLGQFSEARRTFGEAMAADAPVADHRVRIFVLDELFRSTMGGIETDLSAAYRGNRDGRLREAVEPAIRAMIFDAITYLGNLKAVIASGQANASGVSSLDGAEASFVRNSINAWTATQTQLDRLLRQRIDDLIGRLWLSLTLTGAAVCLSVLIAFMTYRHIVRQLVRLEDLARAVRETKDYSRRTDLKSQDEIGRLAVAFNDMLAELAKAREHEVADQARTAAMQSELARVARLTTMGEMAAKIAHEINQPLAAIVTNGYAGLRWMAGSTPDLDEARATLQWIVNDGHRASQVINGIRTMFKQDGETKALLDINDLLREVLVLVRSNVDNQHVSVRTELCGELPQVLADRVQLQQVILNLIMNALDAMAALNGRARVLRLRSERSEPGWIMLTVEDNGTGIDQKNAHRIFEAFFTTKSQGMGMGLSICQSIVEAHDGRLIASRADPHGAIFQVLLPLHEPGADRTRPAAADSHPAHGDGLR
jgi:signal transduction histidine kinase